MQSLDEMIDIWEKHFYPLVEEWDELEYVLTNETEYYDIIFGYPDWRIQSFFRQCNDYFKTGATRIIITYLVNVGYTDSNENFFKIKYIVE